MLKWLAIMLQRAYQLIVAPDQAWQAIKREQVALVQLFRGYAAPLALVPALSAAGRLLLLRGRMISWSFLIDLFTAGLVNYILLLGALLFSGWVISLLAPYFAAKADLPAATRVVVYSLTPVWLSSIFQVVPRLSALTLLGLYGAFLLYTALPVMLETPPEKQTGFAATIILFGLVVMMFLSIGGGGALYL